MISLASRLAMNLAAAAMVCVPVCAQANTRASDHSTSQPASRSASKSGRIAPVIVPDEDDEEGLVWIIGGIALAAIIAIAVSSGNGSQTRTPNQSNGAN